MGLFTNDFYDLEPIKKTNAKYCVIVGERSNGKTYSCLKNGIEEYVKNGSQMAIVRRWRDDFIGNRGASMFSALVENGEVTKATHGEWSNVYYYSGRWYFCNYNQKGERQISDEPFCYAFALTSGEHDKSTSYPKIRNIIFDEFIARSYIPDEFILFMNVLSTIIRERDNVRIYMLGNTINKYNPYFKEMGIDADKMKMGEIVIYRYGESDLTVALEYCKHSGKGKRSDTYFAFNNPKLSMIHSGMWELDIYPHCPIKYRPKDIKFTYFILFENNMLQCEIVSRDGTMFTFIHRKTGELKNPEHDLIYSTENDHRPNWRRRITKPYYPVEKKIANFYATDKVFYQDNEVGDVVRNYLEWCVKGD